MGGDEGCEGVKLATFDINFEDVDELVTYKGETRKNQFRESKKRGGWGIGI